MKTFESYEGLVGAYSAMREIEDEEEEMRYLIKGRDFAIDLCGIIDVLSPLMNIMTRLQLVISSFGPSQNCGQRRKII